MEQEKKDINEETPVPTPEDTATGIQEEATTVAEKEEATEEVKEETVEEMQAAAPPIPAEVAEKDVTVSERFDDVYREYQADKLIKEWQNGNTFYFQATNGITLEVRVWSATIIQFRYTLNGVFERDFSYAVDPNFQESETVIRYEEQKLAYHISTKVVNCVITKSNLKVGLFDSKNQLICQDADGFYAKSTINKGLCKVAITKKTDDKEVFLGLGDKSGALNLRGQQLENWNTDAFGYYHGTDPLYRSVPFYLGLNQGLGYGIFLDNTYKSHFDFAQTDANTVEFYAEGGEMNYYFIYGPSLLEVAKQYTDITGRPELSPLWSLGFHQCRWSYYPETRVKEVTQEFRERKIPCDAIYLDIDYMDGYRCFTWNNEHFPEPTRMINELLEDGFQTVVMIDPGIKLDPDYWVYQQGMEEDVFCKRSSGEYMVGPVWPSSCVFPDFTKPSVRNWWKGLYKGLYVDNNISGFWNDMNEPAVFKVNSKTFPDHVLHDYDGAPTDHRKAHNIYGMQMSRATFEGLKMLRPEKRPFLLTRATFSGGQRFTALWTGDNVANWEHLHYANTQSQRMSLSGFSMIGSDIGGFVGTPTGELLVRWLQLGIFHPFYRIHSMGNNADGAGETDKDAVAEQERLNRLDQEPWSFGEETTELAKKAIELRYKLLPLIYTAHWKYVQTGEPMIKSLVLFDQEDTATYGAEKEFIFGDHLFVSPVSEPEITKQSTYLPRGTWYNFYDGYAIEGGKTINMPVYEDKIPIFVQAGAVVPLYPVMQYTNERPIGTLTLQVYYSNIATKSELYEDEGDGYSYENGNYSLKTFMVHGTAKSMTLQQTKTGSFMPSYNRCKIRVYGLPAKVQSCQLHEHAIDFQLDGEVLVLDIAADFNKLAILF